MHCVLLAASDDFRPVKVLVSGRVTGMRCVLTLALVRYWSEGEVGLRIMVSVTVKSTQTQAKTLNSNTSNYV